jgi:hypothetical protein
MSASAIIVGLASARVSRVSAQITQIVASENIVIAKARRVKHKKRSRKNAPMILSARIIWLVEMKSA